MSLFHNGCPPCPILRYLSGEQSFMNWTVVFQSPELPSKYDILIIGAGYAGITTAIHLFEDKDFEKSVVLLEARRACSGATARNGILPCTTFPNINAKLHKRSSTSANLAQRSWEQQQTWRGSNRRSHRLLNLLISPQSMKSLRNTILTVTSQ
jgi:glycine/D-amino acid oxidase-like deaminating enzyme